MWYSLFIAFDHLKDGKIQSKENLLGGAEFGGRRIPWISKNGYLVRCRTFLLREQDNRDCIWLYIRNDNAMMNILKEMSLSVNKVNKGLQLENQELKHLLLKLMSKYKNSEIKRNVLLKRNAMLITDNKNLHLQLLETNKNKIISEKAVKTYQEAVKLLKDELKELKSETSTRVDKFDTTSTTKTVVCSNMVSEKPVLKKEPSEQYFEVSDMSLSRGQSFSLKTVSPPQSYSGTYASDDIVTDVEAHGPSRDFQKDDNMMYSEVEAYYQMPERTFNIHSEFTNEDTNDQTESLMSDDTKNEEKDPFTHKRDRLWAQIKELREMTKVTDEELQTRRFAVAAKAEMIQNVHNEIKRMQTLISLTK